jgi:hypothetical protein
MSDSHSSVIIFVFLKPSEAILLCYSASLWAFDRSAWTKWGNFLDMLDTELPRGMRGWVM